jgi:phosphocarrier protein
MVNEKVVIVSKSGLHARPANVLIKTAQKFSSKVEIGVNGNKYNAKSLLNILAAGVNCGTEIEVICSGDDEKEACKTVIEVIKDGLGE